MTSASAFFKSALRRAADDYRRALPRAVERGTIFAAGMTIALQAIKPISWVVFPFAFLLFATLASATALLIGVRVPDAATVNARRLEAVLRIMDRIISYGWSYDGDTHFTVEVGGRRDAGRLMELLQVARGPVEAIDKFAEYRR